jgi:hypothetical protein
MCGRKWNFILNSAVGTATGLAGVDESFFIDWSRLPNKPYNLTFTFFTSGTNVLITPLINIFVDLGQQSQMAVSSLDSQVCGRAGYLGKLIWSGGGVNNSLRALLNENPPLYLEGRPTQNTVRVELIKNDGTYQPYTAIVSGYTLQLCLEEVD